MSPRTKIYWKEMLAFKDASKHRFRNLAKDPRLRSMFCRHAHLLRRELSTEEQHVALITLQTHAKYRNRLPSNRHPNRAPLLRHTLHARPNALTPLVQDP
jgi:hypothetical protein